MRRLLCCFGLHSWDYKGRELQWREPQCYGMGLEYFELFECHDCLAKMDRFCKAPRMPRIWPNKYPKTRE